jgi:D-alanyl-D-alanine carboxypeptidase
VLPVRVVAMRSYAFGGSVSPAPVKAMPVELQVWSAAKHAWIHGRSGATKSGAPGSAVSWSAGVWTPNSAAGSLFRAVIVVAGHTFLSNVVAVSTVVAIDPAISAPLTAAAVPFSYRAGCPVAPSSLRNISLNYWTFSSTIARGNLVVTSAAVPAVEYLFAHALAVRFPIREIVPTDYFYSHGRYSPTVSDEKAMLSDDTSAFNCRTVTGDPYRISQHSYGNAIDVNTRENPYVTGGTFYPSNGRAYLNRKYVRLGMITGSASIIYKAMAKYHWLWGGRWAHPDYQHFSSNGG